MARSAQTDLAVLAVLSVAPMSGYAVREAIRDQLGHFWSESFGQIYPTLSTLMKSGFVDKLQGERAGASLFRLTDLGRERLLELLAAPKTATPPRDGLMLRVFFGHAVGPDAIATLIQHTRLEAQQRLETFEGIARMMETETDYPEHRPYWALTVSAGRHSAQAALDWCDEALAALADFPR